MLAERRLHLSGGPRVLTPRARGVAFAIRWSPCIGPTLAAILAVAAGSGSAGEGAALLGVYALGVGILSLLAGLAFTRLTAELSRFTGFPI